MTLRHIHGEKKTEPSATLLRKPGTSQEILGLSMKPRVNGVCKGDRHCAVCYKTAPPNFICTLNS